MVNAQILLALRLAVRAAGKVCPCKLRCTPGQLGIVKQREERGNTDEGGRWGELACIHRCAPVFCRDRCSRAYAVRRRCFARARRVFTLSADTFKIEPVSPELKPWTMRNRRQATF